MGFYDRVIFPRLMNCCMRIGEVYRYRERVAPLLIRTLRKKGDKHL